MIRFTLTFLYLYIFFIQIASSQKDSLSFFYNSFGIPKYQINQQPVSSKQFNFQLAKNKQALEKFNAGKKYNLVSTLMQGAGGFLLGYNLADIMINKKKNYTAGGIGIGLIVISMPLSNYGLKKSNNALSLYHTNDIPPNISQVVDNKPDNTETWKDACLIVRIPVFGPKIKYLKSILSKTETNQSAQSSIQKQLKNIKEENRNYFEMIKNGFEKEFSVKKVHYLPDSLFKSFIAGEKTGFLNQDGELDTSIECTGNPFFFITGKDNDQLLFVDKDLHPAGFPFPYKKSTFLGVFKKLIDRQRYVNKQISYFNEKLNNIK